MLVYSLVFKSAQLASEKVL